MKITKIEDALDAQSKVDTLVSDCKSSVKESQRNLDNAVKMKKHVDKLVNRFKHEVQGR